MDEETDLPDLRAVPLGQVAERSAGILGRIVPAAPVVERVPVATFNSSI